MVGMGGDENRVVYQYVIYLFRDRIRVYMKRQCANICEYQYILILKNTHLLALTGSESFMELASTALLSSSSSSSSLVSSSKSESEL
jgi:hypothetical protein